MSYLIPLVLSLLLAVPPPNPPIPAFSCNETIDAGQGMTFCYPGGSLTLNGSFSGNEISSLEWTPAAGLSDPTILTPQATVNQTTTYTLTIKAPSGNNLIFNGDFEMGNVGFTSDYWYGNPGLSPGGYSIQSNPVVCNGGFSPCGDHTSGSGNMMVVDGATTPGQNFWCQTVPVIPGTDYYFEFYVTTVYPVSPPDVQATFNGTPIGNVMATGNTCEWVQFSTIWNSGGASSVTICLENLNITGFGNDFAVDDIFLREICIYEDEVTITVLEEIREDQHYDICFGESVEVGGQTFSNPGSFEVTLNSFQGCDSIINVTIDVVYVEAAIDQPLPITCLDSQTSLDGSNSAGTFGINTYFWSTLNGTILTNPQAPSVSAGSPGTYQLLVSTTSGAVTCYDSTTVLVAIDTLSPDISILSPDPLSCQDSVTSLTALAPGLPPGAPVDWFSQDGVILSGQNTLNPTVQGIGTYTVTVTSPDNGCTASRSVEVVGDTLRPMLALQSLPLLTCRDTVVRVIAQVLSPAAGFTVLWATPDGQFLSAPDTLQPLVGAPGLYILSVTDTTTGCVSTLQAQVNRDTAHPLLFLADADTLGCGQDSLPATATVLPDTMAVALAWSTPDGIILSGGSSLQAILGGPGLYTLIAENPANGCRDTAAITVIRHEELPRADAGPDLVIDCRADSLQAQSLDSDQGPGISYQWTSLGGLLLDNVLQPWFAQAGTYVLHVLNTLNDCESRDTLTVTDIRALPAIQIAAAGLLTCADAEQDLDASASDAGHHTYLWSGPGLIAGQGTPLPTAGQTGWYILTLTDTLNHCVRVDSVFLDQDIVPPLPVIALPDSLDCNRPQVTLNSSASQPSGLITFQWTTISGNIVNGASGPNPLINAGGWYVLTLTRPENGCTAADSVFVFQDPNLPVASVAEADTLTCLVQSLTLSATYQAPGGNLGFQWTTANGQILSGASTLNPVIGGPGTYVFILTDNDTGCQTSDEVTVLQDLFVPPATAAIPAPLTCADTVRTVSLQGPATLQVLWSTSGGNILGSPAAPQVQAAAPGSYRVRWTNPANGCSDSTAVTLTQNILPPLAQAGPDRMLPCQPQEVQLDGGASQGQGSLTFAWSTANGQIASGAAQASVRVTATGTYLLRVTDAANGCIATDTVRVRQELPQGLDLELTPPGCRRAEGELALFGSTGGQPPYTYAISGEPYPNGAVLLLPPGTYPVSVLDALGCTFDTVLIMPDRQALALTAPEEVWVVYGDSGRIELSLNFPASSVDTVIWDPYLWLSPTADPLVWYSHAPLALQHRARVRTTDGCEAGALIQVLIDHNPRIFVPNVFSPGDGNGINDRFFPYSKPGSVRIVHRMGVYDRWGNQVFLREDFPPDQPEYGWDGHFQGRLMNPAVFIWVLEAELDNGERVLLKGDVTLH
jgi:hypothetical protein